jgi:hypothetical protein
VQQTPDSKQGIIQLIVSNANVELTKTLASNVPCVPARIVFSKSGPVHSRHVLAPEVYFKSAPKLSLKRGEFMLFEHIDETPLFVNNFGMATKLKRYVLSDA